MSKKIKPLGISLALLGLFGFLSTLNTGYAESILSLENKVNTQSDQLAFLCKKVMPQNAAELKEAVKTVSTQPEAQQEAFQHTLSWCISNGYISKEILQ